MSYAAFVKARKNYLGASDAPIIMGVSPWRSPFDLWEDKLGLSKDQPDNYAMKRGRDLEPVARESYMRMVGVEVAPKQVFHPEIKFMMANLDGISNDGSVAVEIKCPGKKDHYTAKEGMVPEKYFPQLQHQLEVCGLSKLHYFSYLDGDTALIEVDRDDEYIRKMCFKENLFWGHVKDLTAPPLEDKDYQKKCDNEWDRLAIEWVALNNELKNVKKKESLLRETLINLSDDRNSIGGGIKLTKVLRKGGVDYSKIPCLKGVDLEEYRKSTITSWRFSTL